MDWTPPPQLRELRLGRDWNLPCSQLHCPSTLHTLTLSTSFNHPLHDLVLPSSLRVLRFPGFLFNHPVTNLRLPAGLERLQIGTSVLTSQARPRLVGRFNQPLHQLHLPATLQWLGLPSSDFCQSHQCLPAVLPPALRVLRLHSPTRMEASGWAELPLPRHIRIEFGPPIDVTITTRIQEQLQ